MNEIFISFQSIKRHRLREKDILLFSFDIACFSILDHKLNHKNLTDLTLFDHATNSIPKTFLCLPFKASQKIEKYSLIYYFSFASLRQKADIS